MPARSDCWCPQMSHETPEAEKRGPSHRTAQESPHMDWDQEEDNADTPMSILRAYQRLNEKYVSSHKSKEYLSAIPWEDLIDKWLLYRTDGWFAAAAVLQRLLIEPQHYGILRMCASNRLAHDVCTLDKHYCRRMVMAMWPTASDVVLNDAVLYNSDVYSRFRAALGRYEKPHVMLALHGTPPENVSSILKNGLDPKLRTHQMKGEGEYFTVNECDARQYTLPKLMPAEEKAARIIGGRYRVIIFALIAEGVADKPKSWLRVVEADHQLPLFTTIL